MNREIIDDAISVLESLGHNKGEAKRLIDAALANGSDATTVEDLVREAYIQPSKKPFRRKPKPAVDFAPQRDKKGQPVESPIEPISSLSGLGPEHSGPPLPKDALEKLAGTGKDSDAPASDAMFVKDWLRALLSGKSEEEYASGGSEDAKGLLSAETSGPARGAKPGFLDFLQIASDAIGVVDQTGATDLANAGLSLGRAMFSKENRGTHLTNALISAGSAVPIFGDLLKLGKYKKPLQSLARSVGESGGAQKGMGGLLAQFALDVGSAGGNGGSPPAIGGNGPGSSPESEGDGLVGGALDKTAKLAGNALTMVASKLGVLGTTAVVAAAGFKLLKEWVAKVDTDSRKMIEANRHLGAFSGQIGASYQALDTGRFLRDLAKAENLGGGISRLNEAQSRFEQSQQNLSGPYEKVSLDLQRWAVEIANVVTEVRDKLDVIGNAIDWFYGDQKSKKIIARNDMERAEQMNMEKFKAKNKIDRK